MRMSYDDNFFNEDAANRIYDDFVSKADEIDDIDYWYQSGPDDIVIKTKDSEKFLYSSKSSSLNRLHSRSTPFSEFDEYHKKIEWADDFGHRLANAVQKSKYSYREILDRVAVSEAQFNKYMKGESIPNGYMISELANAVGCEIYDLI